MGLGDGDGVGLGDGDGLGDGVGVGDGEGVGVGVGFGLGLGVGETARRMWIVTHLMMEGSGAVGPGMAQILCVPTVTPSTTVNLVGPTLQFV